MSLWLIPLDYSVPTLQAYLDARADTPLDETEVSAAADLVERCVRTCEVLSTFAVQVAGRPCPQ